MLKKIGKIVYTWKIDTAYFIPALLHHYVPPPATIVDLCAGERFFYRKCNNGHTLPQFDDYKFIFGDIRDLPNLDYVCDMTKEPPDEIINIADCFIFDPPYPSSTSGNMRKWIKRYRPMPKKDFSDFLDRSLITISKVLKDNAVLITKISHPYNHILYNKLVNSFNFKWIKEIVQVSMSSNVPFISYFQIYRSQKEQK